MTKGANVLYALFFLIPVAATVFFLIFWAFGVIAWRWWWVVSPLLVPVAYVTLLTILLLALPHREKKQTD